MRKVASFVLLVLASACAPQPTSIQLASGGSSVRTLQTLPLPEATVLDAKGAPMPSAAVTWAVAPAELGRLGADGASVELLGEGAVQVTATAGTATASWSVQVELPDAVVVQPTELALTVGASGQLQAALLDGGAPVEGESVAFESSDPAVAAVDGGKVLAVGPGVAQITARWGELSATASVQVAAPEAVAQATEAAPTDTVVE